MSVTTTEAGVEIWWSDSGSGEPLLLIQGLGYTSDMWFRVLPALSQHLRVIRFDNRGVGRSAVPPPPWSIADFIADAVAVLDDAGLASAHVFGVSMGGLIAQELALSHPDRVRSLVLGATHPGGHDGLRMEPAAATMLMDRSARSPREIAEAAVPFLYAEETSRDDVEADLGVRLRYPLRATAYWGQLDALRQHAGNLDRLRRLALPVLVLCGTADRLVQPGNSQILADAIPGARLTWLTGAGHLFWTDQPVRTVEAVTGFIAEVAATSRDAEDHPPG